MEKHGILPEGRVIMDIDVIATEEEVEVLTDRYNSVKYTERPYGLDTYVMTDGFTIIEVEVARPGTSGYDLLEHEKALTGVVYASPDVQLMLKTSHKYLKNSSHFRKTMTDIQHLESNTEAEIMPWLEPILEKREKETYNYTLPNLNVEKGDFFTDDVPYVYDHDSIHIAITEWDAPVYTFFLDGPVKVSEDKFRALPPWMRMDAAVEESCVLAIERSLVGFGEGDQEHRNTMFKYAFMKVCTSITSGWFRKYCWDNYDNIVFHYECYFTDYWDRFVAAKERGEVLLHESEEYA